MRNRRPADCFALPIELHAVVGFGTVASPSIEDATWSPTRGSCHRGSRTVGEAHAVIELLSENGLHRGENSLRVIMMCELPSNAVLADEFLGYFDGFSIGSNDMTQLTLGLDRDSGLVAATFDERDPAVLKMLSMAITACRKAEKYVGICGQGPSDHPDLAEWLVEQGIESMSLNPDTVVETWLRLAKGNPELAVTR